MGSTVQINLTHQMPEAQFYAKLAKTNNHVGIDVVLLADVVKAVDLFSEMRLLECGLMTNKDIQNCSKLTECFSNLLH